MKARNEDWSKAHAFVDTYDRIRQSGLIITTKCLNHETRRIAYIAQQTIAEYTPPKSQAGFSYPQKGKK